MSHWAESSRSPARSALCGHGHAGLESLAGQLATRPNQAGKAVTGGPRRRHGHVGACSRDGGMALAAPTALDGGKGGAPAMANPAAGGVAEEQHRGLTGGSSSTKPALRMVPTIAGDLLTKGRNA
jgi:hypothetical protein